ncbi:hypothetical protein EHV15_09825 [Paenibacillus oralis]|uniref:Uncharacterized protein n=1 Tax=Paenibacillus oralis TaxID=2490856 RepID=A0A3P3TZG5_9BACL|nr:hypothetical protein [Paenibacillus oralis]RRJ63184.1 hypothetical protein EHV15_09825 [Paenibacillus oralis]
MVTSEKWSIKEGYLRNSSEYLKLFNVELCEEMMFSKEEANKKEIIGSYIFKDGGIFAVFSYNGEIQLVLQNNIYNLSNSKFTMEFENLND